MGRPQNSPRGTFAKDVLILTALSAIPTTRIQPGAMRMLDNSTGTVPVLNTTGTTWVYLNTTTKQPS